MIFASEEIDIDAVEATDVDDIVAVYNSHPGFLTHHLRRDFVTRHWLENEIQSMRDAGFVCCKVVNRVSSQILGLLDFKLANQTYLSLLMIHADSANRGLGQNVYTAFEGYVRGHGGDSIRIDVVKGYRDHVWNFWYRNGFLRLEDIALNWDGIPLSACVMKKIFVI